MATYVTLYTFTDQGIRNLKESPERLKAGIEKATDLGIKLLGAWYTAGAYDLIVVSEAEDEQTATAFGLATVAQGYVRSTTMRAFDPDEFEAILQRMP